jgi:hypothetical protein
MRPASATVRRRRRQRQWGPRRRRQLEGGCGRQRRPKSQRHQGRRRRLEQSHQQRHPQDPSSECDCCGCSFGAAVLADAAAAADTVSCCTPTTATTGLHGRPVDKARRRRREHGGWRTDYTASCCPSDGQLRICVVSFGRTNNTPLGEYISRRLFSLPNKNRLPRYSRCGVTPVLNIL